MTSPLSPSPTTMTSPTSMQPHSNRGTMSIIFMIVGVSISVVTVILLLLAIIVIFIIASLWWKKKRQTEEATVSQRQADLIENEVYNSIVPQNNLKLKENVAYGLSNSETITRVEDKQQNTCDYDYVINTDTKNLENTDYDYVDSDTVRSCSLELIATAPNDAYVVTSDVIVTAPNDAYVMTSDVPDSIATAAYVMTSDVPDSNN